MLNARNTLWLSLIWVGCLMNLFFPISALLGFSLGVFFAALSFPFIGYLGIGFYYSYYVPLNFINWVNFNQALSGSLIQSMHNVGLHGYSFLFHMTISWKPSIADVVLIKLACSNLTAYLNIFGVLYPVLLYSLDFLMPLVWFYSCRKIIKKLHIQKRMGAGLTS
jgi:hypothetical protein